MGASRNFICRLLRLSFFRMASAGFLWIVLLTACVKEPAPTSYEASHPHVYKPFLYSQSASAQDDDDRLIHLQLSLLDPPGTMSLVDRAVENHRRVLESRAAQDYLAKTKAATKWKSSKGRKKGSERSISRPGAPPEVKPGTALPPDLASLGVTCQMDLSKDWKQSSATSILEQRGCLPIGQKTVAPRQHQNVKLHLSGIKGNLWDVVRSGLTLHDIEHPRLDSYLSYLKEKPGTVDFLMGRAEPYLRYLAQELKEKQLPLDLIMVPMVESAFQTTAVSPKQAAGLWQFIPSTGQQYGLRLAENYDGRYDTHASTQAALRYLRYLNELFKGDWLLTLAAYNSGEGTVQRAIQANVQMGGRGQFWELGLPLETQNYVVKILALSRIVSDPNTNGFIPRDARPAQSLVHLEMKAGVRIRDLIERSGMLPQEFFKLNPHVRPDVTPPAEAFHFMIPEVYMDALSAKGGGKEKPTSG